LKPRIRTNRGFFFWDKPFRKPARRGAHEIVPPARPGINFVEEPRLEIARREFGTTIAKSLRRRFDI